MIRALLSMFHPRTRYVIATHADDTAAARKRRETTAGLQAAVAALTAEQRAAARDRAVGGRT